MVKFGGKLSPEFDQVFTYCPQCGQLLDWEEKMFEDIERIIVETEEGEEIATIINDDKIDESIIVADGYTVRVKPKAN